MFESKTIKSLILTTLCAMPTVQCMAPVVGGAGAVNNVPIWQHPLWRRSYNETDAFICGVSSLGPVMATSSLRNGAILWTTSFGIFNLLFKMADKKQKERIFANNPVISKTELLAETTEDTAIFSAGGYFLTSVPLLLTMLGNTIANIVMNRSINQCTVCEESTIDSLCNFTKIGAFMGAGIGILSIFGRIKDRILAKRQHQAALEQGRIAKETRDREKAILKEENKIRAINDEINFDKLELSNRRCGQSYELYGKTYTSRCKNCVVQGCYCGKYVRYADEYEYSSRISQKNFEIFNPMKTEIARLQRADDQALEDSRRRKRLADA